MDQRRSPRIAVSLPCTLARHHGGPVHAHTLNLGTGGMCVECDRPLRVDEVLEFDLDLADGHIDGRARVLRQHAFNAYALRFEDVGDESARALGGLVARAA